MLAALEELANIKHDLKGAAMLNPNMLPAGFVVESYFGYWKHFLTQHFAELGFEGLLHRFRFIVHTHIVWLFLLVSYEAEDEYVFVARGCNALVLVVLVVLIIIDCLQHYRPKVDSAGQEVIGLLGIRLPKSSVFIALCL
jgi:hypothetical protein